MASQVVLFAEEDNMFRLMEASLNGVASPRAERALHFFFGESIAEPLSRLTELPASWGFHPESGESSVTMRRICQSTLGRRTISSLRAQLSPVT